MFKLASSIGFALALADLKRRVRRLVAQGVLGVVGAVVFLIGFCFLLVALHLWLSRHVGPIGSAAIVGGVLVLIAVVLFLIAFWPQRQKTTAPSFAAESALGDDGLASLGKAFGSGETILSSRVVQIAAMALVGFLLGRRSREK